jgi:hypothetical protein
MGQGTSQSVTVNPGMHRPEVDDRRWSLLDLRSTGLPDADGVGLRLVVEGDEPDTFLGIFGEDQPGERGFIIHGKTEFIFEDAIDLDLDAAIESVTHIGDDLEATVVQDTFEDARAGDGALGTSIEEDELGGVFEIILADVAGFVGAAGMTGDDVAGDITGRFGDAHAAGGPGERESTQKNGKGDAAQPGSTRLRAA